MPHGLEQPRDPCRGRKGLPFSFSYRLYFAPSGVLTPFLIQRGTVKVDAARHQRGVKIVWLSWFTDSVALWERQDETPYLIDPEPAVANVGPASPPSDPNQISSDPEPDTDDWDDVDDNRPASVEGEAGGRGEEDGEGVALDEVDWDAVNDEVEAAMNESDDEDGRSMKSGRSRSVGGRGSDEEGTDESNSVVRLVFVSIVTSLKLITMGEPFAVVRNPAL